MMWALIGDALLKVLPSGFEAAHTPGTLLLVALTALATTSGTNSLLFATGLPGRASANQVLFATLTIAATFLVVRLGLTPFGDWIGVGYVVSAVIFAGCAHQSLLRLKGLRVPLSSGARLAIPVAVLPLLHQISLPALARLGIGIFAVSAYLALALQTGHLSTKAIQRKTR